MVSPPDPLDAARCDALARRAAAGDGAAWQELVGHVWPVCQRIVGSNRAMRRFGVSTDRVSDVVTNLLGKLGGEGARGLKLYVGWLERHPDRTFADWIRIVTANAARDYVRDHEAELLASADQAEPSVTGLFNQFTTSGALDEIGERPALTAAQTARQLRAYAERHLPADQLQALMIWIDKGGYPEIAAELGLDGPEAAKRLVRAALAVLRRQFTGKG
jgi:DNA-directed RNA polymerase specialized sigma24 family protein